MKCKWLIDVIVAAVAVAARLVWLLCFTPSGGETAADPAPTTPTTSGDSDDTYVPGTLSFTGKVLELDGDSALMQCLDSDRFDTVWVHLPADVTPQVGEEYVVYHEDMVMPSLPPRITAVTMEKK